MASATSVLASLGKWAKTTKGQAVTSLVQSAQKSASSARARLRDERSSAVNVAAGVPIVSALGAGAVDGVFNADAMMVAPATVLGVVATGAGVAMESPTVAAIGSGMVAPAAYRLGGKLGAAIRNFWA